MSLLVDTGDAVTHTCTRAHVHTCTHGGRERGGWVGWGWERDSRRGRGSAYVQPWHAGLAFAGVMLHALVA